MRFTLFLLCSLSFMACGSSSNAGKDSGVVLMDAEPLDCGMTCCGLGIGGKACDCPKIGGPMPQNCACPTSCTDPGMWQIAPDPNSGCLFATVDPAAQICVPDAGVAD